MYLVVKFANLTKIIIEIAFVFVYNVCIAVQSAAVHERRMNIHVYCKSDP